MPGLRKGDSKGRNGRKQQQDNTSSGEPNHSTSPFHVLILCCFRQYSIHIWYNWVEQTIIGEGDVIPGTEQAIWRVGNVTPGTE